PNSTGYGRAVIDTGKIKPSKTVYLNMSVNGKTINKSAPAANPIPYLNANTCTIRLYDPSAKETCKKTPNIKKINAMWPAKRPDPQRLENDGKKKPKNPNTQQRKMRGKAEDRRRH